MIYQLDDRQVSADGDHFIAPSATVIGLVHLKNNASVWFSAVLRGDIEPITIGENSNVQDCVVVHTDPGNPVVIGRYVTVGHKAVLHGCTIADNSLIGINAVVLNGAHIGRNCLIGANTLVTEGKEIPDNSMVLGTPGRVIRKLNEEQINEITAQAERYVANSKRYSAGMSVQERILRG